MPALMVRFAHAPAVLRVELPAVGVEIRLVEERQPLRARQPEQEVAEAEAGVAAVGKFSSPLSDRRSM